MDLSYMLLIFVCEFVLWNISKSQQLGQTKEYCMENFSPMCGPDSVIVMTRARYGRIQKGRCMTVDYGIPPCFNDELQSLDLLCSGRQKCELFIPDTGLSSKLSCLADLTPYLEAEYTCLKGIKPMQDRCLAPEKLTVTKKSAIITSQISRQTSCGFHGSPWILEADPGQNIILKLTDFAWETSTGCTSNYGYILDMKTDDVINICGGEQRHRVLYESIGHSVQIVLEETVVKNKAFLIEFHAAGCPLYKIPQHGWIQKENDSLVVGCEHSTDTWRVRCVDNIWLGIVGNCTPPAVIENETPVVVIAAVKPTEHTASLPQVSRNHVIAFGLGCVTLMLCCTVVIVGLFCTKKYEARILKLQCSPKTRHPMFTQPGTVRSSMIYKPVSDLPPYAFPVPVSQRKDPMTTSDYLAPQPEQKEDDSVVYYVLENPAENMSEEMYQSIKLHHSLQSNNT